MIKDARFTKIIVGLLLLVSLAIRISFVLTVHTAPESDMKGYDERGMLFAEHQSFDYGGTYNGSTYRPPMYILFLAAVYKVFGHQHLAAYLMQALLSVGCLALIYLIGKDLFNTRVGLTALLLSTVYVPFIGYSGILLSEILFLLFLLAGVSLAIRLLKTGEMRYAILSGVFSGLAALTRSISLLLPFAIVLLLLLIYRKRCFTKAAAVRVLAFFLAMFLTISPWTVRNYIDVKQFVLIDSISGLNLLIGNSEYATGFFTPKVWETEGWKAAHQPQYNLPQADDVMKRYAVKWIMQNPRNFVQLTIHRFKGYFKYKTDWFTEDYGWRNIWFNQLNFEKRYHSFLFATFFYGLLLLLMRRSRPELLLLALAVFYFIGLNSLFYVSPRYRLPAMPFMLIYCAYAFCWAAGQVSHLTKHTKELFGKSS